MTMDTTKPKNKRSEKVEEQEFWDFLIKRNFEIRYDVMTGDLRLHKKTKV